MIETDGLYINSTWVMPPDRIATNYQGEKKTMTEALNKNAP